jgi:hypothetical protein
MFLSKLKKALFIFALTVGLFTLPASPAMARVRSNPPTTCKVHFTQSDMTMCVANPTTMTAYAVVDSAPAGATLQLASYIVKPTDKATTQQYFSFSAPLVIGQQYPVSVLWPGIRVGTDTIVEVHFGANVLNAQGNPAGCTASLDFYWYPWVCTPTPTPPTVPEFGIITGAFAALTSAGAFWALKKKHTIS